jgi:uncharacterized membrane protein YjdF
MTKFNCDFLFSLSDCDLRAERCPRLVRCCKYQFNWKTCWWCYIKKFIDETVEMLGTNNDFFDSKHLLCCKCFLQIFRQIIIFVLIFHFTFREVQKESLRCGLNCWVKEIERPMKKLAEFSRHTNFHTLLAQSKELTDLKKTS